ncbi:hypothetical protein TSOC111612_14735 [Tsukamurella ocularis]
MTVSILLAAGAAVIVILLALWIFFHNFRGIHTSSER